MTWITAYAYHQSEPLTVEIVGAPPGTVTLGADGTITAVGFTPGGVNSGVVRVQRVDGGVMPKCRMTLVSVNIGIHGPDWYFDRTGAAQSVSPAVNAAVEKAAPSAAPDEITASVQVGV